MSPAALHFTRTARIWAAAGGLLAGIGWYKGINLMLLLGYLLLGLLAVNVVLARRMAFRVAAKRRPVGPVFAGEPVVVPVDVTNPTDQPATVELSAGPGAVPWLFAPLPAGGSEVVRSTVTFPARGVVPLPAPAAVAWYPFGLVRWTRPAGDAGESLVLPRVGRVDVAALRRFVARAAGGEGRARRPARRPSPGLGDVRGVRPYRPGDSPRDVHWRTTARRNQLVVREYDQTDPLNLVIVVDPWLPAKPDGEAKRRLEWVLELAASVGWAWAASDEPGDLTLIVPGVEPRTGRASPRFVRESFAPLAGLTGTPDVPVPGAGAARAGAVRTARLVVSTRADGPVLAGLRRSGLPAAGVDAGTPPPWYAPPRA